MSFKIFEKIMKKIFASLIFPLFLLISLLPLVKASVVLNATDFIGFNISASEIARIVSSGLIISGGWINSTNAAFNQICLSGVCKTFWPDVGGISPWDNSSTWIFIREGYPLNVNISNILFVNAITGNVGIGTTSPAVSGLHIGSGVPGGQARIQLDNANGQWAQLNRWANRLEILSSDAIGFAIGSVANHKMWIDSAGNVGIGTTSPDTKLVIAGAGTVKFYANSVGDIQFSGSARPHFGSGDFSVFEGQVGSGILRFQIVSGGNTYLVPNGGNVGIGTTSPTAKLELGDNQWIMLNALQSTAGINFYEGGTKTATDVQYGGKIFYDGDSDTLRIVTRENNADKLGISIARATGNVGIGTTSPAYKLDVVGDARISGKIYGATNIPKATNYLKIIRVASKGLSSTQGDYGVWIDGTKVFTPGRSYGLVVIKRDDGSVVYSGTFDVYEDVNQATYLANNISQYNSSYIIIITTYDEPRNNRLSGNLPAQIKRCGGTSSIFESPDFKFRSAYLLVGICDMGEGTGVELYSGDVDSDTSAFVETTFLLADGQIINLNSRPIVANRLTAPNIYVSGNIGIGTTSPAYKLDVNGTIRLQPSSQPDGANGVIYYDSSLNKFRCYQNGVWTDCITSVTEPGAGFWTLTGSMLYPNQTHWNVGIGTTTPSEKLEVQGRILVASSNPFELEPSDQILDVKGSINATGSMYVGSNNIYDSLGNLRIVLGNPLLIPSGTSLSVDSNTLFVDAVNKRVGIGTSSPVKKLDVVGDINATGAIYSVSGYYVGTNQIIDSSRNANFASLKIGGTTVIDSSRNIINVNWVNATYLNVSAGLVVLPNGNVGIGTTSPSQKLTVVGNIGIQAGANAFIGTLDNYALSLRTNNVDRVFITNTGNVGIGTTTPAHKLQVGDASSVVSMSLRGPDNSVTSSYLAFEDDAGAASRWFRLIHDSSADILKVSSAEIDPIMTFVRSSGNVGIGTTTPSEKLEVQGRILVASSNPFELEPSDQILDVKGSINATVVIYLPRNSTQPFECDASKAGAMFYNTSDNKFYGCNSTAWVVLGG